LQFKSFVVSRDEAPLAVVSECLGICFEFEGYDVERFDVERFDVERFDVERFDVERFDVERFDVEGFDTGEALFSFHLPSSIREVVMERVSFSMLREVVQETGIPSCLCFEKCASAT